MQLTDIRVYRGPNVYSHKPVVRMDVKLGEFVDIPTKDIAGFNECITGFFPGLREHHCSPGYPGGFLERLEEGTYLPHVTEHLCIELQRMLGYDVSFGRARHLKDDIYTIIYACINPKVGEACGTAVLSLINALIQGEPVDFSGMLKKLKFLNNKYSLGPSTRAIVDEAEKRGIPVNEIADSGVIRLGYGKYQKFISATMFENTKCISVDIACDKSLTKEILDEAGIPVPRGRICHFPGEALELAEKIGFPLVVKPNRGNQGKSVFMNIESREELLSAFARVKEKYDEVLVEEHIKGRDYRLLVVGGKLSAASERIPAHVVGDGIHTVSELIDITNMDERRGEDHEKPLTKIVIDAASEKLLSKQSLCLDSVPEKGRTVWLKENANLSTGGEAVDCTELVHPVNREIAEQAAKAIGLDIAGIDMVLPDISLPPERGCGAVVEVNASPGIRMHLNPSKGKPRNVACDILNMIYPDGSFHSIPIVSVTGTNGKTTTVRMINHILMNCGLTVGMTTTHGIYINNQCIEEGDTTGPRSAQKILNHREVEAAVLETARGGILKGGLAYRKADVAVFTNLSGDHIGFDDVDTIDDLLHVKSLVIEAVKDTGTCVMNADDEYVMKVMDRAGGKVLLVSMNPLNTYVINHIEKGGMAICAEEGSLVLYNRGRQKEIIKISDIPSTFNGLLVHNVYNCMAAIGAAYALGVPLAIIKRSVRNFRSDSVNNPGRFNMYSLNGIKIIVDYGHNLEGYRATINSVKQLNPVTLWGVIGSPGNRRDEDIFALGVLSASSFDRIIIKEDRDLRGRKPLEVANILKQGAKSGGMSESKIQVIPDETEGLKETIDNARAGDVIVVFFEELGRITTLLKEYGAVENKEPETLGLVSTGQFS